MNPTVKEVWVNTWYDPPKERDAALALINQGVDMLYPNTDSTAVVQLAESKGVYAFGQDSDMSRFGPRAHLSGNTLNWGVEYVHKVRQMLEGKWKSEDTQSGMKEDILSGKFHVFTGPIKDTEGKIRIAAGKTITEDELWQMKWYVDGITGKQPT